VLSHVHTSALLADGCGAAAAVVAVVCAAAMQHQSQAALYGSAEASAGMLGGGPMSSVAALAKAAANAALGCLSLLIPRSFASAAYTLLSLLFFGRLKPLNSLTGVHMCKSVAKQW
jgi:hypothetical protein